MATNTYPAFPPARKDPRQVTNVLKRTLNYNDADAALASFANSLPQGAFITNVMVEIVTAFNAGTTNPITVGTNSTSYNNLMASTDITSGTAGVYTHVASGSPAVITGRGRAFAASGDTAVFATYIPTGTAATQGQAVIVIEYEGGNLS